VLVRHGLDVGLDLDYNLVLGLGHVGYGLVNYGFGLGLDTYGLGLEGSGLDSITACIPPTSDLYKPRSVAAAPSLKSLRSASIIETYVTTNYL